MAVTDPFFTFTTDNVNPPEAIIAQTNCRRVTIQENGDSTQDYQVRKLSATSTPIKRQAGLPFTFSVESGKIFNAGTSMAVWGRDDN